MKTKFLSVLALGTILFSACSSDNDHEISEVNDGRVKFSSNITVQQASAPKTRAADDKWDANDFIGIYMLKTTTDEISEGADNIEYESVAEGVSVGFKDTGHPIYYPVLETNLVDFMAYYPYAQISNYHYPINVATQISQSGIDLLYTETKVVGKNKTNPDDVELKFAHQLSKLKMKLVAGNGVNLADLTEIKIEKMYTKNSFNLMSGELTTDPSEVKSIAPARVGTSHVYEAILLPTLLDNTHVVEITLGGNIYKWVMVDAPSSLTQLEKGKLYDYTITINKIEMTMTGSIKAWNVDNIGTGTAY